MSHRPMSYLPLVTSSPRPLFLFMVSSPRPRFPLSPLPLVLASPYGLLPSSPLPLIASSHRPLFPLSPLTLVLSSPSYRHFPSSSLPFLIASFPCPLFPFLSPLPLVLSSPYPPFPSSSLPLHGRRGGWRVRYWRRGRGSSHAPILPEARVPTAATTVMRSRQPARRGNAWLSRPGNAWL